MNPNESAQNPTSEPEQSPQSESQSVPVPPQPSVPPPPTLPDPQPIILTPNETQPPVPGNPKKSFKIAFVLVPVLVILGLVFGSALFVVYAKVPFIPFELKAAVSSIVLKVPFLPKTTEYVLVTAADANKDIRSGSVDASLALSSQVISDILQTTDLDITATGAFDFNDENSSLSDFNFKYGNYVDADLLTMPKNSFFRFNRLDTDFVSFLSSLKEEDLSPILNVWVKTERSVTTSAREKLEEERAKSRIDDMPREDLIAFLNEDLLPRVQMVSEDRDGSKSFRMSVPIDQDLLQKFISRMESLGISEVKDINNKLKIESGLLEVLVSSKTYYIQQVSLNLVFVPTIPTIGLPGTEGTTNVLGDSTPTEVRITLVVDLSDHTMPLELQEPEESISVDEYVGRLSEVYMKILMAMYDEETLKELDLSLPEEPLEDTGDVTPNEGQSLDGENTPFGRMLP